MLYYNNNLEIIIKAAFPAEVIASIRILYTYKEAVEDPKYVQQWRAAMAKEILTLYINGTFEEVVPLKGVNLVLYK